MAETNGSGNETSLKQMFQGMIPKDVELLQGTVAKIGPLKIQMSGDEKLFITERITIVPWHLTDYTTKLNGSPATVSNALKVGETVHVLSINHGKLYYVLDRVAGQVVG